LQLIYDIKIIKLLNSNDTKDSVNVTSPLSKAYVLVDVKEVYRLSQAFTVVMNRRIYNADKDKFENAVKQSLTKTLKGMKIKNNIDVKYHLLVQI
jgi:hypothetical protein